MTWIAPESEAELGHALAGGRWQGGERLVGIGRDSGPDGEPIPIPTGGGEPGSVAEAMGRPEVSERDDVISLESSAFADVVEYEPKDLTITVGAGTRLSALRDTLDSEGQWLPPGACGRARSVGGFVGAGTPGPFDAAFGSVRRHVLAVRTIAWDGRPLTWGRAVVKNVAGYDLKGLWCGSRGRLGVVTQAALRVWPQPECREWLEVRGESDGWTLLDSLASLEPAADFRPDALLWRGATSARGAYAVVGLLGSEASVCSRGTRARTWAAGHGFEVDESAGGDALTGPLGSPESRPRSLVDVALRIRCPRASLARVARRVALALAETPGSIDALPEPGILGVSYVRPDDAARAAATRAALFQAVDGCPLTMERGGPEELAASEERRDDGVRIMERAVLQALGGGLRHWLADYV